ncbi:MAG: M17 family metallopeptidase [Bdellovibrionales bacterium]
MSQSVFKFPKSFITKAKDNNLGVQLLKKSDFKDWIKDLDKDLKARVSASGFEAGGGALVLFTSQGKAKTVILGVADDFNLYDAAKAADALRGSLSKDILKSSSFTLKVASLKKIEIEQALIGFAFSNYVFDIYKESTKSQLTFVWPSKVDKKRVQTITESAFVARNLINIPANDMGPDEMEAAVRYIGEKAKATVKIIKGAPLEKGFPLIHTVGKASPRAPRLIELNHGKTTDPKLTIVGKGVVFDTGGLDIKPSQYMRLMKKDMGGGAHALALAKMVIDLKLPVRLRLLIPCVENSVGGAAFRPGDIITSRKGLTVENTNTDAEGRLILADALTYASEETPDLIIDFATLTGSARAALGPDIPAMFANDDTVGKTLQTLSMDHDDPLWQMPLWADYNKTIAPSDADLHNSAGVPGDLIYSALFLQNFLVETKKKAPEWVHLDLFAWESSGRPGRAKGATDMGLRAVFAYLEERYG